MLIENNSHIMIHDYDIMIMSIIIIINNKKQKIKEKNRIV